MLLALVLALASLTRQGRLACARRYLISALVLGGQRVERFSYREPPRACSNLRRKMSPRWSSTRAMMSPICSKSRGRGALLAFVVVVAFAVVVVVAFAVVVGLIFIVLV